MNFQTEQRLKKTVITFLFSLVISINLITLSYAEWYQDENGWRCGDKETNSSFSNIWGMFNGLFHCFDENGYLRTNQMTPDGYLVDEKGALIVDNQVIRTPYYIINTYEEYDAWRSKQPTEEVWKSGTPYIGRWIGIYDFSGEERTGSPFEININRDENGNMYAEVYELKYGIRTKVKTYEFLYYGWDWYAIDTGESIEVFEPVTLDYMNSVPEGELLSEELEYWRIVDN